MNICFIADRSSFSMMWCLALGEGEVRPISRYWEISLKGHRSAVVIEILIKMQLLDFFSTILTLDFLQTVEMFPIEEESSKCCTNRSMAHNTSIQVVSYYVGNWSFLCLCFILMFSFQQIIIIDYVYVNDFISSLLVSMRFVQQVPTSELILRPKEVIFFSREEYFWQGRVFLQGREGQRRVFFNLNLKVIILLVMFFMLVLSISRLVLISFPSCPCSRYIPMLRHV